MGYRSGIIHVTKSINTADNPRSKVDQTFRQLYESLCFYLTESYSFQMLHPLIPCLLSLSQTTLSPPPSYFPSPSFHPLPISSSFIPTLLYYSHRQTSAPRSLYYYFFLKALSPYPPSSHPQEPKKQQRKRKEMTHTRTNIIPIPPILELNTAAARTCRFAQRRRGGLVGGAVGLAGAAGGFGDGFTGAVCEERGGEISYY